MSRYIGLDAHARSCTLAVVGPSGKHIRTDVVETNGQALVEYLKLIPRPRHLIFEEGTQSAWLYELLDPHVDDLVVTAVAPTSSRGQKSDAKDAFALAERLRLGKVERVVYKEVGPYGTLRELGRVHTKVVADHVRCLNRLKSLYRSRGIEIEKGSLWNADKRPELLGRLPPRMRSAAEVMFAESDALGELRKRTEKELTEEAKKHTLSRLLRTCPGMGPIRVALLLAIVVSPHRFRSRRQFWAYCGLGIVMRSSSDWMQDKSGKWVRAKIPLCRGLNRNHNHTMKWIFKGAATTVITGLPKEKMHADYQRTLAAGTKPNLAKLTLARKIAATVLSMWKNQEAYDSTKRRSQDP
jgi:transposase